MVDQMRQSFLFSCPRQVKAVFLHVVTYNEAAIQLYESCGFLRIKYFPHFYYLHGTRDSTSQHLKVWDK